MCPGRAPEKARVRSGGEQTCGGPAQELIAGTWPITSLADILDTALADRLRGTVAAALTPLRDRGDALDEEAFTPMVEFLAAAGLDGVLALGTTGEGILLSGSERLRATELFVQSAAGRLRVIAHCGAQTTRETTSLAAHAAGSGADGVAVIGPPYFAPDERALLSHFSEAARACSPLPFYVYEFAARAGYQVPLSVLDSLRLRADNFVGLKVSDTPWERFAPYLIDGLDVFVGPEQLIDRGMNGGAVGAVSALAAALPELVIAAVKSGDKGDAARCGAVRDRLQAFPFHTALKRVLAQRGVPIRDDVRSPLRTLTAEEGKLLSAELPSLVQETHAAAS